MKKSITIRILEITTPFYIENALMILMSFILLLEPFF